MWYYQHSEAGGWLRGWLRGRQKPAHQSGCKEGRALLQAPRTKPSPAKCVHRTHSLTHEQAVAPATQRAHAVALWLQLATGVSGQL
jgi:hypothetical protein